VWIGETNTKDRLGGQDELEGEGWQVEPALNVEGL